MKYRFILSVIAASLVLTTLTWLVARESRTTIQLVASPAPLTEVATPTPPIDLRPVLVEQPRLALPRINPPQPIQASVPAAPVERPTRHVALPGETVTSIAADVFQGDTQANRDAFINANASLQADPDRVVAGKTYVIPSAGEKPLEKPIEKTVEKAAPATVADTSKAVSAKAEQAAVTKSATELKYVATAGDTVSNLAGAFLGGDGKAEKNAIINANASLQDNPNHVVAGETYRIPAPDGLSTSGEASLQSASARPTTQPDSDDLVTATAPRTLRYTARTGDTLTSMAIALLGSDTSAARASILSSNASLKNDPDRVVVGETYWIPAPTAAPQTR